MRQTVTIQKAAAIAKEFDDADFTAAVESAETIGLKTVEIITVDHDGEGAEIFVARPRSIMIAWKPRPFVRERVSLPTGEPASEIHMTLLYLGDLDDYDLEAQRTILGVVTEVAQKRKPIYGRMNGVGRFLEPNDDGETALWIGGDFVGLRELRDDLKAALNTAGITWDEKYPDFQPHMTIGWIEEDAPTPMFTINPFDAEIDNVTVYIGGLEYEVKLDGPEWGADGHSPYFDDEYDGNLYVPILKAAKTPVVSEELRYTYGPWYVPDSVDLHNEWANRDDVQKALWDYVDRGDRGIRLQHNPEIVAGRWVELATVPFPLTVPVEGEAGVLVKHTYPAGTPFMGVIWEEWAWPLVKAGEIRGFSIGGTAERVLVDMPETGAPSA